MSVPPSTSVLVNETAAVSVAIPLTLNGFLYTGSAAAAATFVLGTSIATATKSFGVTEYMLGGLTAITLLPPATTIYTTVTQAGAVPAVVYTATLIVRGYLRIVSATFRVSIGGGYAVFSTIPIVAYQGVVNVTTRVRVVLAGFVFRTIPETLAAEVSAYSGALTASQRVYIVARGYRALQALFAASPTLIAGGGAATIRGTLYATALPPTAIEAYMALGTLRAPTKSTSAGTWTATFYIATQLSLAPWVQYEVVTLTPSIVATIGTEATTLSGLVEITLTSPTTTQPQTTTSSSTTTTAATPTSSSASPTPAITRSFLDAWWTTTTVLGSAVRETYSETTIGVGTPITPTYTLSVLAELNASATIQLYVYEADSVYTTIATGASLSLLTYGIVPIPAISSPTTSTFTLPLTATAYVVYASTTLATNIIGSKTLTLVVVATTTPQATTTTSASSAQTSSTSSSPVAAITWSSADAWWRVQILLGGLYTATVRSTEITTSLGASTNLVATAVATIELNASAPATLEIVRVVSAAVGIATTTLATTSALTTYLALAAYPAIGVAAIQNTTTTITFTALAILSGATYTVGEPELTLAVVATQSSSSTTARTTITAAAIPYTNLVAYFSNIGSATTITTLTGARVDAPFLAQLEAELSANASVGYLLALSASPYGAIASWSTTTSGDVVTRVGGSWIALETYAPQTPATTTTIYIAIYGTASVYTREATLAKTLTLVIVATKPSLRATIESAGGTLTVTATEENPAPVTIAVAVAYTAPTPAQLTIVAEGIEDYETAQAQVSGTGATTIYVTYTLWAPPETDTITIELLTPGKTLDTTKVTAVAHDIDAWIDWATIQPTALKVGSAAYTVTAIVTLENDGDLGGWATVVATAIGGPQTETTIYLYPNGYQTTVSLTLLHNFGLYGPGTYTVSVTAAISGTAEDSWSAGAYTIPYSATIGSTTTATTKVRVELYAKSSTITGPFVPGVPVGYYNGYSFTYWSPTWSIEAWIKSATTYTVVEATQWAVWKWTTTYLVTVKTITPTITVKAGFEIIEMNPNIVTSYKILKNIVTQATSWVLKLNIYETNVPDIVNGAWVSMWMSYKIVINGNPIRNTETSDNGLALGS